MDSKHVAPSSNPEVVSKTFKSQLNKTGTPSQFSSKLTESVDITKKSKKSDIVYSKRNFIENRHRYERRTKRKVSPYRCAKAIVVDINLYTGENSTPKDQSKSSSFLTSSAKMDKNMTSTMSPRSSILKTQTKSYISKVKNYQKAANTTLSSFISKMNEKSQALGFPKYKVENKEVLTHRRVASYSFGPKTVDHTAKNSKTKASGNLTMRENTYDNDKHANFKLKSKNALILNNTRTNLYKNQSSVSRTRKYQEAKQSMLKNPLNRKNFRPTLEKDTRNPSTSIEPRS